MKKLKVGTRGSKLATTQTRQALDVFQSYFPDVEVELVKIKTKGDHLATHNLQSIGGQGCFVRELEYQLRAGNIDFAIHSLKDIPTDIHDELTLACVMKRHSPTDALLIKEAGVRLETLPKNAVVGTSSLRRKAQLLHVRPDFDIQPIRGNIDTRIRKMNEGQYDAIVLALAGLERLGLDQTVYHQELPPQVMLPAIGQGALALECRKDNTEVLSMIKKMEHAPTEIAVTAERAFLGSLDGSCTFPVGAYCQSKGNTFELTGMIGSENGQIILKETMKGNDPIVLGKTVAAKMVKQGAITLIEECKNDQKETFIY
ncbi:hydroxymethylbilane synthase [Enterococcus malodoratus]|uniref:Porphobilinogen deaminase n=1 Tax=Enterococcus malodoratus ATCC 43197 TaxID=1158601 RepID=R2RA19_9ENTE|nr:hydroxymethylbilane synthase [Enterococcus malodoratus]EOH80540.1 porphobilinogen deaminase [Enterococcus malodoratus ATCC 43197]EOT69049.1 porphobilinogen deaminase [Enterococcus malodoratus ATCC 43197]OJG62348.1 porphobilinogen deaminase [Enterococcus malodoratus]SPW67245.1 Porphobilinogen deaminase [Enterococcus malodoratus]STC71595.1 Porphobilinogen deaminase [Enterococcus malodoratus]